MKVLAGVLGAIVLIGAGVGGTLGVQHFTGGESADCQTMNATVKSWIATFAKQTAAPSPTELDSLDKVMDIRYKACRDS